MKRVVLFIAVLLLAGCGGKAVKPAAPVQLRVVASADVNPDDAGRASPVVLRVYAFADATEFLGADFEPLFADDKAALPGGWRYRHEALLLPASEQTVVIDAPPGAKQLCAMAAYRDRRASHWRRCVAMPAGTAAPSLQVQAAAVEFQ